MGRLLTDLHHLAVIATPRRTEEVSMYNRSTHSRRIRGRGVGLALAGVLLVAACGSDDNSASSTPATAAPSATAAPGATDAPAATEAPAATDAPAATEAPAGTAAPGEIPEWQQLLKELETMPFEELHAKALEEEDGRVIFWNGNSVIPADRAGLGPAFEAAFPGMSVTLFGEGSTQDMIARVAAERDAGLQPSGDLFWASLEHANAAYDEGIVIDWTSPEHEAYPDELKGSFYVVTDFTFHGVVWNTDNVSADEVPTSFDDLTDPKWKGRLVAEPRIATQLTALASHKFEDDAAARAYAEGLAANEVTFVPRYPALVQALAAGEHDVCFNCNLYNTYDLIQEGAPLAVMESETMALPDGQMIFAEPLHPYGAMLMARWMISEDGQKAWAAGVKNPARPGVEGGGKTIVPEVQYRLTPADVSDLFPAWDEFAADLFDLR
jgi:iron(III) transport system substrate-binding protein